MQEFVLKGCGGHARSVADAILSDNSHATIIFVDKNAREGEIIMGFPVKKKCEHEVSGFIPAIGDCACRKKECENIRIESYISTKAHIGREAKIGEGCFIGVAAHLGPEATVGKGTIVNTNAVVEHNVKIGEFCHIAPNATICGGCSLGDIVLIGAGSVLKPNVQICSEVTIGAGSVVIKNITEPGTYVGVPVKRVVENEV